MTPEARQHALLPHGRGRAAARLPGLQALPARRHRPARRSGTSRADVVGRAMRLIADGVVDREGVGGLAGRLGYSERHLTRLVDRRARRRPAGDRPRAARADGAHADRDDRRCRSPTSRSPPASRSVRQFNDTVREVFAHVADRAARPRAPRGTRRAPARIELRLPYRAPFDVGRAARRSSAPRPSPASRRSTATRTAARSTCPTARRRSRSRPGDGHVACTLRLADVRDLAAGGRGAAGACSTSTPTRVAIDDGARAPIRCSARSSRRGPGCACRAASTRTRSSCAPCSASRSPWRRARTLAGRASCSATARRCERPTARSRTVPDAAALAARRRRRLAMPGAGARHAVAAVQRRSPTATSTSIPAPTATRARRDLRRVPGIGPWTAEYVRDARARRSRRVPGRRPRRPACARARSAPTPLPRRGGARGGGVRRHTFAPLEAP